MLWGLHALQRQAWGKPMSWILSMHWGRRKSPCSSLLVPEFNQKKSLILFPFVLGCLLLLEFSCFNSLSSSRWVQYTDHEMWQLHHCKSLCLFVSIICFFLSVFADKVKRILQGFMFCLAQIACIFRLIAVISGSDELEDASEILNCFNEAVYCT